MKNVMIVDDNCLTAEGIEKLLTGVLWMPL